MAVDLVDRLAILVAIRRFSSMGAADSRALRSESYACMKEYERRFTFVPFRRCLGNVRSDLMAHHFFMARWVPISVMPCRRG
jgi:hypothetical protein